MQSFPLVKFKGEAAYLPDEGLEMLRQLPGTICPVIFIGDGRGGKSYLASRLLGSEGTFVSSDSCEPVTEGIDMAAVPIGPLLETCGDFGSDIAAEEDEHLLILDCEGGNNAMAAIRTLVNVLGIILGTEVVFVASGMATEQALQTLGASLAVRSLIRTDGDSGFPEQRLIFVVNKNTLKYDENTLEKILGQKYEDPGRQELRDSIKSAFSLREFFAVPLIGMPDFESQLQAVRTKILRNRRPLDLGGTPIKGEQLVSLLQNVVSQIEKTNQVSFPSMNRFVIFDGFLMPVVKELSEQVKGLLPQIEDYDPELESKNPCAAVLKQFDTTSAHIQHALLVKEARDMLEEKLTGLWHEVHRTNEAFGEQVAQVSHEQREVVADRVRTAIGGRGLLKRVVVTKLNLSIESRALIYRKRGGEPETSPWTSTGANVSRFEESAFDRVRDLPSLKGVLQKRSPNLMRAMLKVMNIHNQERVCILKDGHFLWWAKEVYDAGGEAKGCINFLVHHAEVVADKSYPTIFTVKPASGSWLPTTSFTGGGSREFHFDVEGDTTDRDRWVEAIREHIEFGNQAREQLGEEKIMKQVGDVKPKLEQLEMART